MGTSSSRQNSKVEEDRRGLRGLFEDIQTVNRLAPCFRKDNCQLFFAALNNTHDLNEANFKQLAIVGVKRVKIDGTDAVPGGGYKTLRYKQFLRVLKRMQSDSEVALQAQMALRGWVEPDKSKAERILMEDGRIVSVQEAERLAREAVEEERSRAPENERRAEGMVEVAGHGSMASALIHDNGNFPEGDLELPGPHFLVPSPLHPLSPLSLCRLLAPWIFMKKNPT